MSTGVSTMGAFSRLFPPPSGCDPDVITKEVATVEEPGNPGQSDIDQVAGGSTVALGTDAPSWARPYKSARTRAVMATIALSLILASIVSRVWILENYDTVVLLLGDEKTLDFWWTLLSIVVVVGGAVTILLWFARAYRNLPALGAHELTYSPRSAVGWWFVPVVSMVAPLRVTIELFKASDPSTRPNGRRERRQAALPKLVVTWWIVFLAALILDRLPISSEVLVWFALDPQRPGLWLAVGLLAGGALGNLADRVRAGAVTDFIDPPLWPTFNLADVAITLGALVLVVASLGSEGDGR